MTAPAAQLTAVLAELAPLAPLATSATPPVECIETHISWVLLAGDYAWKLKKPLTLPFLDYGTLEKRRACCELEVALNQRFAPQLYLGVVDLAGEPAVKMHRFDAAARLDHVCQRGELTPVHLTQLARSLAAFQAQAAVPPAPTFFGAAATIRAAALENFEELFRLLPAEQTRLTVLEGWTQREFAARETAFVARQAAGRVREGHGDLHLGNLVLLDGHVTAFDCIEFNDDFRWIDVASEIAFTLLDLLDHAQPGLATWLLDAWLAASGDYDALGVLRFYLVYRALVRAKVVALRGNPEEAEGYLDIAQQITDPPAPTLTISFGPSGSGKTYETSRRLASADFLDTVRVRSDVERKRLFGLPAEAASDGSIYTADATVRTYTRLAELAAMALKSGWSVMVDAAFLKRAERDQFRALAARLDVPCAILATTVAGPTELARRIAARQNDASEATVAVLAQQLQWLEPLGADEPRCPPIAK